MTGLSENKQVGWRINDWRERVGGFSRATIYNWIAEGRLETAKVGGARVILTRPQDFLARNRDGGEL